MSDTGHLMFCDTYLTNRQEWYMLPVDESSLRELSRYVPPTSSPDVLVGEVPEPLERAKSGMRREWG